MFIYWDGYEIDGSDTSFDIILPQNRQAKEFVDCFMSIPLFSDRIKPYYAFTKSYSRNYSEKKCGRTAFEERLLSGDYKKLAITLNCKHLEECPAEFREEVYKFSETRDPHEKSYGIAENPCTPPEIQQVYTRGSMTVDLNIYGKNKPHTDWRIQDGYCHNLELFETDGYSFEIECGPGFYYEYAMYIMEHLREHFPGLATAGGLDCNGGWTGGCTYANSLYGYERILLPVEYSVKNLMKRLTEYDIIRSYRCYYKNGWKTKYTDDSEFMWVNSPKYFKAEEAETVHFTEYVDLVGVAVESATSEFACICETAVQVALPKPTVYEQSTKAYSKLIEALGGVEKYKEMQESWGYDRYFYAYLSFFCSSEGVICDMRVCCNMKKYFMTLMELAENGEIDFIKPITYERRKQSEKQDVKKN
jgi:hypothetical protein